MLSWSRATLSLGGSLGLGEVSPGTGRNALPCSPRHSDSSHIQCIAGDHGSQVRRRCLGAIHQSSALPAGRFPNFSASSPPALSSVIFPQTAFHPLISPLPGAATPPCYCALDVRVVSSPPSSLLTVSSPVPPTPTPTPPPPTTPGDLPCPLLPVLGSASAAQASPSHSWTIVPASSPASWPPVCPLGGPRSVFVHSELSLILLCSRPSPGTPEPWTKV